MKRLLHLFFGIGCFCWLVPANAQQDNFPAAWTGHWKGELSWWSGNDSLPRKVEMELRIGPADSAGHYHWHLVYGGQAGDSRPYLLKPVDVSSGHWQIDEGNGIILDQFWVASRLSGAFTVMKSTIVNTYWLEGDILQVEFYNFGAAPISTTGKGDENIPFVHSYRVRSYQRANLRRQ